MSQQSHEQFGSKVMQSYGAVAHRHPPSLHRTLLRHPTRSGIDVITALATNGRATLQELQRVISEGHQATSAGLSRLEPIHSRWMGRLSAVLALMASEPRDRADALLLLEYLRDTHGWPALDRTALWLLGQLSLLSEKRAEVMELIDAGGLGGGAQELIETDLANPNMPGAAASSEDEWLRRLSDLLALEGADRLALRPEAEGTPPFDRLDVRGPLGSVNGPLVTVIVTSYRPGADLMTALRSVLSQTWQDVECLVVDDGSPAEYTRWLDRAAELDERVRLVRLRENAGTYGARNAGLDAATGDFVAFQDSDDWSHPRRLERQMQPLLQDESLQATTTQCVRVDDDIVLTEIRRAPLRRNESSLLFRREPVLHRIGYFDAIRKGADSEYRQRIEAAFNDQVSLLTDEPALALIRRTTGSLSRAEFKQGWRHRARFAYRDHYQRWHHAIRDGADPYVARGHRAPFPAPVRMEFPRGEHPRRSLDIIVCADWRDGAGNDAVHAAASGEVRALAAAGCRVGLAHVQSLYRMSGSDDYLGDTYHALLEAGLGENVLLDEEVDVGFVMLHEPDWLQFPPLERPAWDARSVRIVAGWGPVDDELGHIRYLTGECSANTRDLFGVEPVWAPQSDAVRRQLERSGEPGVAIASTDHRPVYPSGDPGHYGGHGPEQDRDAVVGRWSRESKLSFPETGALLRRVYDAGAGKPVIVGGATLVDTLFGEAQVPGGWTVRDSSSMRFEELLDEVDVIVHINDPRSEEDLDWMTLVAVERGVPIVLPYRYRERLGPLAVYATPREVPGLVARMRPTSDARAGHVAAARKHAVAAWGPEELVSTVERVVAPRPSQAAGEPSPIATHAG